MILPAGFLAEAGNLLQNSGFETYAGKSGQVPAWEIINADQATLTNDHPHTGESCLQVKGKSYAVVKTGQDIPVELSEVYMAEIWVRSSDRGDSDMLPTVLSFSHDVFEDLYQPAGRSSFKNNIFGKCRPMKNWTRVQRFFVPKEESIPFSILIPQSRRTEIDDCVLRMVAEDDYRGNLVVDGTFEEDTAWNKPSLWFRDDVDPVPGSFFLVDDTVAHRGKKSLVIKGENPPLGSEWSERVPRAGIRTAVGPVKPGRKYRLKIWMKADREGALVRICFSNFSTWWRTRYVQVGPQWQEYVFVPRMLGPNHPKFCPNACEAELKLRLHGEATVWIDDISVTEVE